MVGFQPEFYKNWYITTEENEEESSAADNVSPKQFIHDHQSVMAKIKSVPWFDLSLRSIIK